MTEFTAIDVSRLPAPAAVEVLDFEVILADMVATLTNPDVFPQFSAITESDPAYKVLIVCAYREMVLRQRINDATRQNMLAFATGSNLDHLAANLLITRKVLVPADPETNTPAVMESDAELRRRVQLAPESYTTAGSAGSYVFHALGAHPDILDASVDSPEPGEVVVTILSRVGDGVPSTAARDAVVARLSGDTVRPLTDLVTVNNVTVVDYAIEAEIYTFEGPDSALVIAAAQANAEATRDALKRIARDIPLSAIYAALHVEGVSRVVLITPASSITIGPGEVGHCTVIELIHGGIDA
ncbi:baseplate assembly protein [Lysobacter brunescens]|uniref:Baseplate J/gp47 family protein n=1 Tax=Lysobacter brunescens TaxID=262323 RepID=A0ABW2YKC5_9GAMM